MNALPSAWAGLSRPVETVPLNTGANLLTYYSDWLMAEVTAEWEGGPDSDDTGKRWFALDLLAVYVGEVEAGDPVPFEILQHLKEEAAKAVYNEVEDLLVSRWERSGRRLAA